MEIDLLSLGIGFASGFLASFLGNLSYDSLKDRRLRQKRDREAYLTVTQASGGVDIEAHMDISKPILTYSNGEVEIEVHVKTEIGKTHVSAREIEEKLQEAYSSEPKKENTPD